MCSFPSRNLNAPRGGARRGSAMVETAFLVPLIFFLFVGVFDVGFYCYALMTTANAARIAALATSDAYKNSATATAVACPAVLGEMQSLPNVYGNTTTCSAPVTVTFACNDHGPNHTGTACSPATCGPPEDCSSQITVTYVTVPLVPIPGILPGQFTFTQTAEVRFGS
jgi:Flp pilus assembly protein TadG